MDDSIAGLRALVALADAGGFTAAGRTLGISRSAVSKAVTRLEQRLDTRLVERSSRALQLTEEGRALHLQGRRVLPQLALPVLPINLLWPRGRHLPRRARVVIDALASELGQP